MPKIKLFRNYDYIDGDCSNTLKEYSVGWQEVTDEELKLLTSIDGRKFLNQNYSSYYTIVIFEDNTDEIPELIKDIKKYIADYKTKEEKRKLDLLKKKEETKAKREKKEIEKAKKLLKEKGII